MIKSSIVLYSSALVLFGVACASGTSGQEVGVGIADAAKYRYTESGFSQALIKPGTRILEEEGWFVWDSTPICGEDGKIHVFFHDGRMISAIGFHIQKSRMR